VIEKIGAGEGNRTLVISLEGCCSTIELHPRLVPAAAAARRHDAARSVRRAASRPRATPRGLPWPTPAPGRRLAAAVFPVSGGGPDIAGLASVEQARRSLPALTRHYHFCKPVGAKSLPLKRSGASVRPCKRLTHFRILVVGEVGLEPTKP
jgi:hypothetical protein